LTEGNEGNEGFDFLRTIFVVFVVFCLIFFASAGGSVNRPYPGRIIARLDRRAGLRARLSLQLLIPFGNGNLLADDFAGKGDISIRCD
jgi:hypothetical protein